MNRYLPYPAGWWLLSLCLFCLGVLSLCSYTLPEGQEVLIIRLGAPAGVQTQADPKFKFPFIDTILYYDTRLQMLAPPPEQIILGDEKRLEVETYTRYQIADTLRFYQALRTEEQARLQLAQLVSSTLRRELGKVQLKDLLSVKRSEVMQRILQAVAQHAQPLGLQVTEVHLHRADLPLATSQAIYDRMKSARQQEAKELRAQGVEWAQQIQAKADRDRTVMLSEAQSQSSKIRGQADAHANAILARVYQQDPHFYRFYRSLQTYRTTLANTAPTLILSPDTALLHDFKHGLPSP